MEECIIIILSKTVTFLTTEESPSSFDYGGNRFFGKFSTDNNGFFDWLRNKSSQIIGVRWTAYDEQGFRLVADNLLSLSNVEIDGSGSICIYFGQEVEFDESISCDQDFGENNFYITAEGLCAISFSTFSVEQAIKEVGEIRKEIIIKGVGDS